MSNTNVRIIYITHFKAFSFTSILFVNRDIKHEVFRFSEPVYDF